MVATASNKGTVLRFFDLENGAKLHEVRRGKDHVSIQDLSFEASLAAKYLTCTSNKDTIHIFASSNIGSSNQQQEAKNTTSYFSYLSTFVPVLASEWSFAQVVMQPRVNEATVYLTSCVDDVLTIATTDGMVY